MNSNTRKDVVQALALASEYLLRTETDCSGPAAAAMCIDVAEKLCECEDDQANLVQDIKVAAIDIILEKCSEGEREMLEVVMEGLK